MKDKKIWKYFVLGVFVVIIGIFYYKNNVKDTTEEASALFFEKTADVNTVLAEQAMGLGNEEKSQQTDVDSEVETKDEIMYIHVCGAVIDPGVYELTVGSRVIDAVTFAGGFKENAAMDAINQAQKLTDGVRLYIPTLEDIENTNIIQDEYPVVTGNPDNVSSSGDKTLDGKVNINTADKNTLMNLPGIGESKAQSIITYREKNGAFKTISDIQKISGIKEAVFNKIKDYITVTE
ncbi:helix-hairpin-helix domain-containing protein [Clostridium sp. Marseille-P299]|uniref:helix-hairpin-helix domain-containing protein n=1 Tax=Clostridium sp. Marseille-P299 TaxID=1805477 RepID=UPI00083573B4|nr:helix-hairpin-helix domain-containing protein [Clostridium sp. Marseille-P299]